MGEIRLTSSRRRISDAVGLYAHKHRMLASNVRRVDSLREEAVQEYEQYERNIQSLRFYKVLEEPGTYLATLVCAAVCYFSSTKVWFCEPFDRAKEGVHFLYTDALGQPILEGTGWTLSHADAIDEFSIQAFRTLQGRKRIPVHVAG